MGGRWSIRGRTVRPCKLWKRVSHALATSEMLIRQNKESHPPPHPTPRNAYPGVDESILTLMASPHLGAAPSAFSCLAPPSGTHIPKCLSSSPYGSS